MENKEIIIDSVDVSECHNHYNGWSTLHRDNRSMCDCGYDTECKPKYFECSYYVKCLEEQLKRKEQALDEIEKYLDAQQKYFDGEDYHNLLDIIDKTKERKCT